jgi:hypothetical protein
MDACTYTCMRILVYAFNMLLTVNHCPEGTLSRVASVMQMHVLKACPIMCAGGAYHGIQHKLSVAGGETSMRVTLNTPCVLRANQFALNRRCMHNNMTTRISMQCGSHRMQVHTQHDACICRK